MSKYRPELLKYATILGMQSSRKTLFISDLHLQASQPAITETFLDLLKNANPDEVDALYILGDLFEAWIGDDDASPFNQVIISSLRAATSRGIKIYFLHGNRDFLINKKFANATGVELIQDETVISLYDKPILLMHGDTLCTNDKAYLRSRKWMRNPVIQAFFLMLPLNIRRNIANKMRAASHTHTKAINMDMMDVTQDAVLTVMRKHNVKCLIHGHTHRPQVHSFELDDQPAKRIVLAAWDDGGADAVCVIL